MAVDDFDEDGNKNICYAGASALTSIASLVLSATALSFLAWKILIIYLSLNAIRLTRYYFQ